MQRSINNKDFSNFILEGTTQVISNEKLIPLKNIKYVTNLNKLIGFMYFEWITNLLQMSYFIQYKWKH